MFGVFMDSKADILTKGIQGFCEITYNVIPEFLLVTVLCAVLNLR